MKKEILEEYMKSHRRLIDIIKAQRFLQLETDEDRERYYNILIEIHKSNNRKQLLHSREGFKMVIFYMKVWNIDAKTAFEELVTDAPYRERFCP